MTKIQDSHQMWLDYGKDAGFLDEHGNAIAHTFSIQDVYQAYIFAVDDSRKCVPKKLPENCQYNEGWNACCDAFFGGIPAQVDDSKPFVDRSEAVNLARNVADGVLEGHISPNDVLNLCQAVLRMDGALK
jgi:hypothetical protein